MALLDRLRPQPGWKHPDPATRVAAIETLAATEQALFATLARDDEAPRVRRAAVARLDDPEALGAVAANDADDQVKTDAVARLTRIAIDGGDVAMGQRAVAALTDERHLGAVARSGAPAEVCDAALARIGESKALGGVARHAERETVRLRALSRLNDRVDIEAVATHTEHKDVGLAALERLDETAVLERIAVRAKEKVVARRAKAIVKDRAAADAEVRAAAEAQARRRGLLTDALDALEKTRDRGRAASELERLTEEWRALGAAPADSDARWQQGTERVRMHIDDLARQETADAERRAAIVDAVARRRALIDAAQAADGDGLADRLAALRAEWATLTVVDADELKGLDRAFSQACTDSETRAAARARAAEAQGRLAELAAEATQLAEADTLDAARTRWTAVTAEWRDRTAGLPIDATVRAQYAAATTRWQQREQAAREAAARSAAENLARLQELGERATSLSALKETPIKDIDRAVRDLRGAIEHPGTLPSGSDELVAKLKATLASLTPRLREARETDDWRRWANAGIQEELCKRIEALRELTDVVEVSKQLRDLRRQWKAVSAAPKDDGDALWQRFKTAADEIQVRVDTHLATVVAEQAANLAKKMALVEKAEALAQSTDWIATADTLKALQAEWNTIGAATREQGPKDQTSEVAKRFRAACDTFFTRRKTDLVQRKGEWAENQQKKEALCARMEELAESTEWTATFNEIKKLQADWKTVGPVRRNKSEALWKRFRGACDRFFERYGKRHEIDLRHRVEEREAICRTLEALAPGALAAAAAAAASSATATPVAGTPAAATASSGARGAGTTAAASEATSSAVTPSAAAPPAAATGAAEAGRLAAAAAAAVPETETLANLPTPAEAVEYAGTVEAEPTALSAAPEDIAPESQDAALADGTIAADAAETAAAYAAPDSQAPAGDDAVAPDASEATADAAAPNSQAAADDGVTVADAADASGASVVSDSQASAESGELASPVESAAASSEEMPEAAVASSADAPTEPQVTADSPIETAPEPPAPELVRRTVEDAVRRWRQAPGLPSEALVPVRARFESALTSLLTGYAPAFQGTPFDLENTRRRMKALCEDVETAARGLPAAQLGSTSVAALASLLKESLAANTIGGRVNEEAKLRAAADRVRRAQSAWRELGPALDSESHQLESRFHRAVRRFFEEHPQLDQQPHRDQRDQRDQRDHRDHRSAGGPGGHGGDRDRDRGGPRGPRGPRPQGGPPRPPQRTS